MKAAVFHAAHRPLEVTEIPTPEPGPGQVLVKVAACGLCHTDLHFIDHDTPTFKTPPLVLGHEISGTIAALGEGVAGWKRGREGPAAGGADLRGLRRLPRGTREHLRPQPDVRQPRRRRLRRVRRGAGQGRLPAAERDPARRRLDHRRRHHHAVSRRRPPRQGGARRLGAGAGLRRRRPERRAARGGDRRAGDRGGHGRRQARLGREDGRGSRNRRRRSANGSTRRSAR